MNARSEWDARKRKFLLMLGLASAFVASLLKAAPPAASALVPAQTVDLQYKELKFSPISFNIRVQTPALGFAKKPAVSGDATLGILSFGDESMGCIWDSSARKLYLDLNGNKDLTDDPGGVFSCPSYYSTRSQIFTNVHLSFKTASGTHLLAGDLHFYQYGDLNCSMSLRSFWEGKVSLQGRDWQIGLVENPARKLGDLRSGYLVLRPWEGRVKSFNLQDNSAAGFAFCTNLFFGNKAYRIKGVLTTKENTPGYQLELTEQEAVLGELKLPGQFIERLVLAGQQSKKPFTVALDRPGAVAQIPEGSYYQCEARLEQGGAAAYYERDRYYGASPKAVVTIKPAAPALLAVGGPLTNSVTVKRKGKSLSLNYSLLGMGGAAYQLVDQNRSDPPRFTILQAGKKVGSGKFAYG